MKVNGKALVLERPGICTIAEMIDGEVLEELIFWKVNMQNYFKEISAKQAMKHDSYERHRGALAQRRWSRYG